MTTTFPAPAPRIHGGPDALGVPLHDFSSNSNACAPCPAALAAVQQADASRYPDASYSHLRAQLASFHGVHAQRLVLAASASEFIFRMTALAAQTAHLAGQGGTVWLPPHSYGDYAQAASAHRLVPTDQVEKARLLWACEPSSPLGAAQAGLGELIDLKADKAMLVLDCAYEAMRLAGTPPLSQTQLAKVWQLWTPNKALGLTGVRAAYAIAPAGAEDAVLQLDRLSPSWPVGAHGVAMLQAWTSADTQVWLAGSLVRLRDWKARQLALCESMGWSVQPSVVNYFCARPHLPPGLELATALHRLRASGIKLRDTTSFGLPGQVRLSVQAPAAQQALHNAWQDIIKAMQ